MIIALITIAVCCMPFVIMFYDEIVEVIRPGIRIILIDHDGEVTVTKAYNVGSRLVAKRYRKSILLMDGGKVLGPSYVDRWEKL